MRSPTSHRSLLWSSPQLRCLQQIWQAPLLRLCRSPLLPQRALQTCQQVSRAACGGQTCVKFPYNSVGAGLPVGEAGLSDMHSIRVCSALSLVLNLLIAWAEAVQGCIPSQRVAT